MKKLLLLPVFLLFLQPSLIAQWVSTQGPYGGYVYQLKSNSTYVFAVKNSGLYRSLDVGLNWEQCASTNLFGKLALDGPNLLASYDNSGEALLQYSPDNGDHWIPVPLPGGTPFLTNFALNKQTILFVYQSIIWRSSDLGQTWDFFEISGETFHQYQLFDTFDGFFQLGNRTRLLTSEDGLNWTYLSNVPGNSGNSIKNIFKNGELMLSISGQTIGRSLDGGVNWEIAATENNGNLGGNNFFSYENGVYYLSTGKPMFSSTDNGLSWKYINADGPKIYYHTSKDNILLGHLFGLGVFRSTDGGQTFEASNHGLGGGDVLTIGLQNKDLWLWDERGVVRQNTDQLDWDAVATYPQPTLFGSFVTIKPFKNAVFIRADHGELLRTFDGGQSWTTVTPDASIVSSDFIEFNQQGDSLFLSSEFYNTYLSTDFGDHWEILNPQVNNLIGSTMKDMAVQGETVFVTDNQQLFRSDDHLSSWQAAGGNLPFGANATKVRIFSTPRFLFAFVNLEQVFQSDDQGETWTEIFLPFPPVFNISSEHEIVFAEIGAALISFFEQEGIYISHDDGQTWSSFEAGIPTQAATCFAYNETSMWAGTYYFGLYQRSTNDLTPLSTTVLQDKNTLKIYPNPTQGTFSCKLPPGITGDANLTVFDLQGKQMLRRTESAEHVQNIDLSCFAKGVYWVSISTSKGVFGGKVFLE